MKLIHLPRKSISFDAKFEKNINDKTNFAKNDKNGVSSPPARRKSKFNFSDEIKSVNEMKKSKKEKTDHVISLLHIIKTLKKAANLLKSRAGISPVQQLNANEIAFMNDLSFFPDISNKRFFLKRYTEKNVFP